MNKLSNVQPGQLVWCGSDNGIATPSFEKVERVTKRIDTHTNEEYSAVWLSNNHIFDSRTGNAINAPLGFYIINFLYEMVR